MAEVTLDAVSPRVRDLFNKGFSSLERGRLDYAIDMLTTCLKQEPGLLQARRFLWAAEIQRFKQEKTSSAARMAAVATSTPAYLKALALFMTGKGLRAMEAADNLLRDSPIEKRYMLLFAQAAEQAGYPEASVLMLEIARDHFPEDEVILERLGHGYVAASRPKDAVVCFEKICEKRPNDPKPLKALKDAMALNSLASDWNDMAEGDSFRKGIRDVDEAKRLEQEGKAVKTDQDVDDLVSDTIRKLESEPDNINYYRALARLYVQKHAFDEAADVLRRAMEKAPGDPELENTLSEVSVQRFNADVASLREAGKEQEAAAKEIERDQYVFNSLQDRVQRYPNDLGIRYDFGVMLFENHYITESIQQFQLSQRSPKHRAKSLYYLGLCFRHKKQYDMAMQQLETAAKELTRMDNLKKDIVYAQGEVAEAMGNSAAAAGFFKQIYQVDIRYRDVAEKIEKVYSKG
jgi:tetratricopeptide (TPR) repeat protein